mgnify:CR=1 FL=1
MGWKQTFIIYEKVFIIFVNFPTMFNMGIL